MINIKIARIRKRLTQKDIAELMDVNINTVSRWETGAKLIPVDKLIKLADILEVSLDYLAGRE